MCQPDKIDMEDIFNVIAGGKSLIDACEKQKVSPRTFMKKVRSDSDLEKGYTLAREVRGERCAHKIDKLEEDLLSGTIDVATYRALTDTEKWKASKFYPKMFGEHKEVEVSGNSEKPVVWRIFNGDEEISDN